MSVYLQYLSGLYDIVGGVTNKTDKMIEELKKEILHINERLEGTIRTARRKEFEDVKMWLLNNNTMQGDIKSLIDLTTSDTMSYLLDFIIRKICPYLPNNIFLFIIRQCRRFNMLIYDSITTTDNYSNKTIKYVGKAFSIFL